MLYAYTSIEVPSKKVIKIKYFVPTPDNTISVNLNYYFIQILVLFFKPSNIGNPSMNTIIWDIHQIGYEIYQTAKANMMSYSNVLRD